MKIIITEEQDERIKLKMYQLISSYLDTLYNMEVKKKYENSDNKVFIFRNKIYGRIDMVTETNHKTLGINATPLFNSIRTLFTGISPLEIKKSLEYYIKLKTGQKVENFHNTTWD